MNNKIKNKNLKIFLIVFITYMIVCLVEDTVNFYYPHSPLNYISLPIIFVTTFSLILGPIGIVGSSIGQLIYGIYTYSHFSNNTLTTYVLFYPLTVLVIGFFVYKLYHALNFKNRLVVYLNNGYNLISLMVTILITNVFYIIIVYSVKINILGDETIKFGFIEHYFSTIYVVLPVTILFISILNLLNVDVILPKKSKYKISSKYLKPCFKYANYYPKLINSLLLLLTMTLIVMAVCNNETFTTNFYNTNTLLIVLFIIFLVFLKPSTKNSIEKNGRSFFEFISLIIIIQFVVINLLIYVHINSLTQFTPPDTYLFYFANFHLYIIIPIVLINLIIYYFTNFFLQKYITKPLNTISEIMINYTSNKTKGYKEIPINLKDTLKDLSTNKYEVGSLAYSFKNMIDELEEYIKKLSILHLKNEKITFELLFASKIQEDILPNIFLPFPDRLEEFDIYTSYNPSEDVGGICITIY
ncbi:MAG: hypothetical protein LBD03_07710 [Methanobrevibacter sp.]|jgi:HAMP domain-containing protein|nr:hypothetical protein [Candidatus Methanovirga procula]